MMQHAKSLLILSGLLLLINCSGTTEPRVVTTTEYVEQSIPIVSRPRPVQLSSPNLYVVNENNLEEFLVKYKEDTGSTTFIAMSVDDYEKMTLNIAELRRYIAQQKEIIIYYENSVSE